jgi:hypothetical protein
MTQESLSPKLERSHDTRLVEQAAWASWYRSPIGNRLEGTGLLEEPQCRECAIEGRTAERGSTLADGRATRKVMGERPQQYADELRAETHKNEIDRHQEIVGEHGKQCPAAILASGCIAISNRSSP